MAFPDDLSTHALRLRKRMGPIRHNEELYGYTLSALAEALSAPSDPLAEIVRAGDDHEPWGHAVDPYTAPGWILPWLGSIVGAGAPAAPHMFEFEQNLVMNPGAEVDTTTMAAGTNSIVTRQTSGQRTGVGVYRIQASATGSPYSHRSTGTTRIPVKEGLPYSLGSYVRAVTAGAAQDFNMRVWWYTKADALIGFVDGPALTTTDATYIRLLLENVVAPAGAAKAEFETRSAANATVAGNQHYIDDLMMVQGTTLPTFFYGATADDHPYHQHTWVGTPHASYSIHKRMQTTEEWVAEIRDWILNRPRWRRGQPLYIRNQILLTLDHVATINDVRLMQRSNGPWRDSLVITASRTPNQARTTAAAMAEKPAMREWTITYTDEPVINEWTDTINSVTEKIDNLTLPGVT